MTRYLPLALAAQLRAGRALFALAVVGIALGVGAVLSIQILNGSALGAFTGSVRAISGDAQLSVVGRGPALDDALVVDVLAERGVRAAVPIYRVEVALEPRGAGSLEVVGTDLFAPARSSWGLARGELGDLLGVRGWIAVTPELARDMGWAVGSRVAASSGSRRVELVVGALVDFRRRAPLAPRRLAVMDIAQAQALLGAPGRVQQIDVLARLGADVPDLARRLQARLGERARVATPEARIAEAGALLEAFRLNLTALSFVSLLVGGFLVYASTQAALSRRREELGILRCLGATRAGVLGLLLADALLLGALGTAAGIPLGWAAARANVAAVSATIKNLYLLESVERVTLTPGLVALGAALGLAGALAGALAPALDVAREDPRALLGRREPSRGARAAARVAGAALLALAATAAVALGPARGGRWMGFLLALVLLAAAALVTPVALAALGRAPFPRRLGAAYGARDLAAHLRATAVPAGALATAVSMLAGITVMIGSFRGTVEEWLAATLRADVYVTTPSWRRGQSEASLAPDVAARLARAPGVRAVDRLRALYAEVGGRRISVSGFDAARAEEGGGRVQFLAGDPAAALRAVRQEGAALVSEPLARRAGLAVGGEIDVAGPRGPERFRIAGIYRDYGAESGAVLVDLAELARRFGEGPLTNMALYVNPGVDPEREVEELRRDFAGDALLIRSNRTLRSDVLRVFEQTFAVTRLLQAMSLVVAACGVTLALLVLARERSAEVALYRALGATRAQVFRVFVGRGLGIALAGLALGALGGAGLAWVLVEVINPAWFGWSLALHPPWGALAGEAALLVVAALGASAYPAATASGTPATELARDAL